MEARERALAAARTMLGASGPAALIEVPCALTEAENDHGRAMEARSREGARDATFARAFTGDGGQRRDVHRERLFRARAPRTPSVLASRVVSTRRTTRGSTRTSSRRDWGF